MLVTTIIVPIVFLTLFILYPLAILLVDAVVGESGPTLSVFQRVLAMPSFETAISNTLVLGLFVGIVATLIGLLFAYVEVYVNLKSRFVSGLFKLVSMLPVVSPPFVLSLSVILLFGKAGLITRTLLGIYDNNVYGFWGIALRADAHVLPFWYDETAEKHRPPPCGGCRDIGRLLEVVFTSVTLPLILPGMGNAFLVSFMESIADFANPMIIGGSYDTLATSIYLQITGAYDKEGPRAVVRASRHNAHYVHRSEVRARAQEHGYPHGQSRARSHAHRRQLRAHPAFRPVRCRRHLCCGALRVRAICRTVQDVGL